MKNSFTFLKGILVVGLPLLLASCYTEDPGPLQEGESEFAVLGFDRIEMGSAFHISIEQGTQFNVIARGDRRNLDDLMVYKDGTTLVARYKTNHNRKHQTHFTITLPDLKSVNLSGATYSTIRGFGEEEVDVFLSGASYAQLEMDVTELNLVLSGASNVHVTGIGEEVDAELSGASILNTLDFDAATVKVNASGASKATVYASDALDVKASGASSVLFDGDPSVTSNISGGSTVTKF